MKTLADRQSKQDPRKGRDMRPEYNFRELHESERGKYATRYAAGIRLPKEPSFPVRLKYWIEGRIDAWRHRHTA
jgi:hypothetical protein